MSQEIARDLLENLLERAIASSEKTFLTSKEIAALAIILGVSCEPKNSNMSKLNSTSISTLVVPTSSKEVEFIIRSLNISIEDIQASHTLCIDFGTSLSKAFACIDNGRRIPELIDLPIGDYPGSSSRLATPSEMMIYNGYVYFGHHARKVFDDTESSPDRIIDSIKQYMTLNADVSNLERIRVNESRDPNGVFFQRDILLLYLSHLTRLVENALVERGLSQNTRRRFAHPGWPESIREKNINEMRKLMAEAVVLSRSLGDALLERLPITSARQALDDLQSLKGNLP